MSRGMRGNYSTRGGFRGSRGGSSSYMSRGRGAGSTNTRFNSSYSGSSDGNIGFNSRSRYSSGPSDVRHHTSSFSGRGTEFKRPSYHRPDNNYSSSSSRDRSPDRKRPKLEALSSRNSSHYSGGGSSSDRSGNRGSYSSYHSSEGGGGGGVTSNHHYSSSSSFGASNDRHNSTISVFRRPLGPPLLSPSRNSSYNRGGGSYRGAGGSYRGGGGNYRGGGSSYRGSGGRISSNFSLRGGRFMSRGGPGVSSTPRAAPLPPSIRYARETTSPSFVPPPRRRVFNSSLNSASYGIRRRVLPSRVSDYERRLKISKMRSEIAERSKKHSSSEKASATDEKTKDGTSKDTKKLSVERSMSDNPVTEKNIASKERSSEKKSTAMSKVRKLSPPLVDRKYIKLECPHCGVNCRTFHGFELHYQSKSHVLAMRKVAFKVRTKLANMRVDQRSEQNEVDRSGTSQDSDLIGDQSNFCLVCKLNYKQSKSAHHGSEAHKRIKRFMQPVCSICTLAFKTPMAYQHHLCCIEHLKLKQHSDTTSTTIKKNDITKNDEEDDDNNFSNLTTIDSVGGDENQSDEDIEKSTAAINVGIEQINSVQAHYCELCHEYVARGKLDDVAEKLSRHCKTRTHMQLYVRYTETKELEKRAEKLQRKENAEKVIKEKEKQQQLATIAASANGENTEQTKLNSDSKNEELAAAESVDIKTTEHSNEISGSLSTTVDAQIEEEDDNRDDKLWEDVDKDLDDILAKEESAVKSSDDEDEEELGSRSGRYDRFKYSDNIDGGNSQSQIVKFDKDISQQNNNIKDEVKA